MHQRLCSIEIIWKTLIYKKLISFYSLHIYEQNSCTLRDLCQLLSQSRELFYFQQGLSLQATCISRKFRYG